MLRERDKQALIKVFVKELDLTGEDIIDVLSWVNNDRRRGTSYEAYNNETV